MRLTIKEALRFGGLEGARVVAGARHLDREIESVTVLEVAEPKISTWVVKNELYITSLYAIRDDVEMQRAVIKSLFNYGCCALVICHIGLLFDAPDLSVVKLCDELPLPLIIAKPERTYAQIIQPIVETLLKAEEHLGTVSSFKIRDDFLDLIINEDDMLEVFRKISIMLKYDISYYDIDCNCIYSNKNEREVAEEVVQIKDDFNGILDELGRRRYTLLNGERTSRLVYPIRTRRNFLGFIVIDYTSKGELQALLRAADALNVVCALSFSRQNKRADINEKYLQELLGDLLVWNFRNDEVALRRCREYGIELQGKNRIVVVNVNTLQQIPNQIKNREQTLYVQRYLCPNVTALMRRLHKNNLTLFRSDTLIIFLEDGGMEAKLKHAADKIIALFRENGDFSVSIGISELFEQPGDIPAAYKQAFFAAISGRRHWGENRAVTYRDVWFYQKLEELARTDVKNICHDLFSPLEEYDRKHRGNLVETLIMLLKHNNNISLVSKMMYLHRNALLHRKNKIVEIYGYSPFETPYLLKFLLTIEILEK